MCCNGSLWRILKPRATRAHGHALNASLGADDISPAALRGIDLARHKRVKQFKI